MTCVLLEFVSPLADRVLPKGRSSRKELYCYGSIQALGPSIHTCINPACINFSGGFHLFVAKTVNRTVIYVELSCIVFLRKFNNSVGNTVVFYTAIRFFGCAQVPEGGKKYSLENNGYASIFWFES